MNRRYKCVIFIMVFLLSAILIFTSERILLSLGDFLVLQEKLQIGDIIHVIAGPEHRTDYGIRLYQKGYGKKIFFTGGLCIYHNYYHGRHSREQAYDQGVKLENIFIDDSRVTSTYSEVVRLKELIAKSQINIKSVIVVSDPHHMRRARWVFRRVLGSQISVQMAPVPFELSPYQDRWWADEESRRLVRDEYLKIFYYYFRYGIKWKPLADLLAVLDRS